MLRPIPQESPQGFLAAKKKKQQIQVSKIHLNLNVRQHDDQKFFQALGSKLINFAKKAEISTISEIGELIHHLQRLVLVLQRKKLSLMRKNRKKK